MASVLEQYRKRSRHEGVAPSKQTFRWRGVTMPEMVELLGGVPSLRPVEGGQGEKAQAEAARDNLEFSRQLLLRCVEYPRIVESEAEAGDDGLPFSDLYPQDVEWLTKRIMAGASFSQEDAESARRVL